jgi:cytochrome P450
MPRHRNSTCSAHISRPTRRLGTSWAREREPVHYAPKHGWYIVTKAELVREVLRDPQRFSSRVHKHT